MESIMPEGPGWSARRKVTDEEYERAKAIILPYLAQHRAVTNREFRQLTQLSSDQAVTCFNRMIAEGLLLRVGKNTSTKYLLRSAADYCQDDSKPPRDKGENPGTPPPTSTPNKDARPDPPVMTRAFICEVGRDLL